MRALLLLACALGGLAQPNKLQPEPFDCSGKPDGLYGVGCSSAFWFCNRQTAARSSCSFPHHRFDPKSKICDYPWNIEACGGGGAQQKSTASGPAHRQIGYAASEECSESSEHQQDQYAAAATYTADITPQQQAPLWRPASAPEIPSIDNQRPVSTVTEQDLPQPAPLWAPDPREQDPPSEAPIAATVWRAAEDPVDPYPASDAAYQTPAEAQQWSYTSSDQQAPIYQEPYGVAEPVQAGPAPYVAPSSRYPPQDPQSLEQDIVDPEAPVPAPSWKSEAPISAPFPAPIIPTAAPQGPPTTSASTSPPAHEPPRQAPFIAPVASELVPDPPTYAEPADPTVQPYPAASSWTDDRVSYAEAFVPGLYSVVESVRPAAAQEQEEVHHNIYEPSSWPSDPVPELTPSKALVFLPVSTDITTTETPSEPSLVPDTPVQQAPISVSQVQQPYAAPQYEQVQPAYAAPSTSSAVTGGYVPQDSSLETDTTTPTTDSPYQAPTWTVPQSEDHPVYAPLWNPVPETSTEAVITIRPPYAVAAPSETPESSLESDQPHQAPVIVGSVQKPSAPTSATADVPLVPDRSLEEDAPFAAPAWIERSSSSPTAAPLVASETPAPASSWTSSHSVSSPRAPPASPQQKSQQYRPWSSPDYQDIYQSPPAFSGPYQQASPTQRRPAPYSAPSTPYSAPRYGHKQVPYPAPRQLNKSYNKYQHSAPGYGGETYGLPDGVEHSGYYAKDRYGPRRGPYKAYDAQGPSNPQRYGSRYQRPNEPYYKPRSNSEHHGYDGKSRDRQGHHGQYGYDASASYGYDDVSRRNHRYESSSRYDFDDDYRRPPSWKIGRHRYYEQGHRRPVSDFVDHYDANQRHGAEHGHHGKPHQGQRGHSNSKDFSGDKDLSLRDQSEKIVHDERSRHVPQRPAESHAKAKTSHEDAQDRRATPSPQSSTNQPPAQEADGELTYGLPNRLHTARREPTSVSEQSQAQDEAAPSTSTSAPSTQSAPQSAGGDKAPAQRSAHIKIAANEQSTTTEKPFVGWWETTEPAGWWSTKAPPAAASTASPRSSDPVAAQSFALALPADDSSEVSEEKPAAAAEPAFVGWWETTEAAGWWSTTPATTAATTSSSSADDSQPSDPVAPQTLALEEATAGETVDYSDDSSDLFEMQASSESVAAAEDQVIPVGQPEESTSPLDASSEPTVEGSGSAEEPSLLSVPATEGADEVDGTIPIVPETPMEASGEEVTTEGSGTDSILEEAQEEAEEPQGFFFRRKRQVQGQYSGYAGGRGRKSCRRHHNHKTDQEVPVPARLFNQDPLPFSAPSFEDPHSLDKPIAVETAQAVPDPRCVYSHQMAVAVGQCQSNFLVCTPDGVGHVAYCIKNELFDHALGRCVPAGECGDQIAVLSERLSTVDDPTTAEPIAAEFLANTDETPADPDTSTTVPTETEPITTELPTAETTTTVKSEVLSSTTQKSACAADPNGVLSLGSCRSDYVKCYNGMATRAYCARVGDVFSSKSASCVARARSSECASSVATPTPSASTTVSLDIAVPIEEFCLERYDGFYRHPKNCSRIIQCFDKEVFEYPACDYNLAFDELNGVCDYRDRVSGCAADAASVVSDTPSGSFKETIGAETSASGTCENHGDHLAHESDCSKFNRCVWGRLEQMHCPAGTVFNPRLSVCDYPDQVPGCSSTGAPALVTSPL